MLATGQLADRTERALRSAAAAGRELGLTVEEPTVLYDVFSVVAHLAPTPVVVRVPTAADLERARREWAVLQPLVSSRAAFAEAFPGSDIQPIHGAAPTCNIIVTPDGELSSRCWSRVRGRRWNTGGPRRSPAVSARSPGAAHSSTTPHRCRRRALPTRRV